MKIKTLFLAAALAATALPGAADAVTVYSYIPGVGYSEVGDYETTGVERIAEEKFQAVVSIDGYRDVPIYVAEHYVNPNGSISSVERQTGTITKRISAGSGFFITSDGYILTNEHVVGDGNARYYVNTDEGRMIAGVVYLDSNRDLAVLKVNGSGYSSIKLAEASDIAIGEEVAAVGNALGRFVDSISSGEIISLDETVIAREKGIVARLDGLIATDARLYPGDSGGPLLNSRGEAVGVNVAIVSGANVSFAIPADVGREVARKAGLSV